MNTVQTTRKRRLSPILISAAFLSLASLAWTTWSLIDLLGTGAIGATVATGADIIWGSVIIAEARGLRVAGKKWTVPAFGWAALLVVASFLCLHGYDRHSVAMAVAGPFLPFGAKAVWVLAIADMRDPSALTHEEQATIAEMERRILFEEKQHESEMRRRKMNAELQMLEVSTDFDIELMRQDCARELERRRPIALPAAPDAPRITAASRPHQPHPDHDAPHPIAASPAQKDRPRITTARTDAVGEVADRASDAPLTPREAPAIEAHHADDAALRLDGLSKAAAVRAVRDALPTASAPQIVERLAHHGIDASDAYVRTVLSRTRQQNPTANGGYL